VRNFLGVLLFPVSGIFVRRGLKRHFLFANRAVQENKTAVAGTALHIPIALIFHKCAVNCFRGSGKDAFAVLESAVYGVTGKIKVVYAEQIGAVIKYAASNQGTRKIRDDEFGGFCNVAAMKFFHAASSDFIERSA